MGMVSFGVGDGGVNEELRLAPYTSRRPSLMSGVGCVGKGRCSKRISGVVHNLVIETRIGGRILLAGLYKVLPIPSKERIAGEVAAPRRLIFLLIQPLL